eukprot:TRINITY_DN10871_c0_g1_i1.p1 TRINITY_DN10871_c0_g1~~TRINITY_DN10871_c0_g1_i1.p1  ORF type:complete len:152 (-),score=3.37 TRINITY_DN10871_c0_g1_i1:219-674(-)
MWKQAVDQKLDAVSIQIPPMNRLVCSLAPTLGNMLSSSARRRAALCIQTERARSTWSIQSGRGSVPEEMVPAAHARTLTAAGRPWWSTTSSPRHAAVRIPPVPKAAPAEQSLTTTPDVLAIWRCCQETPQRFRDVGAEECRGMKNISVDVY